MNDSGHIVGKGPFVYKQTYLANLLGYLLTLWFIWFLYVFFFLSNYIYCLQMFDFDGQEDDQATYDLSPSW